MERLADVVLGGGVGGGGVAVFDFSDDAGVFGIEAFGAVGGNVLHPTQQGHGIGQGLKSLDQETFVGGVVDGVMEFPVDLIQGARGSSATSVLLLRMYSILAISISEACWAAKRAAIPSNSWRRA